MSLINSSPMANTAGNPTQRNNQNCGDLFPFIEELKPHLPKLFGSLSIKEVLNQLKQRAPNTFEKLDQFILKMKAVSELNDDIANMWKVKGNEEFGKGNYSEAISAYTHGLLCAASDEMVATLLNNRSTSFYKLNRFADSCVDAHKCLQRKPDYWKTLTRRGTALQQLGFKDVGEKDIKAAEAQDLEQSNSMKELEPILGESLAGMASFSIPPSATISHSVRVERSSKGRGIVAKERLVSGTTILEETPYACVARLENLLSTCSFCLQHTTCLYHGDRFQSERKKSRGLFCSDACANAAWQHYGESEGQNLFFLCCPNDALLAYRMLQSIQQFPIMESFNAGSDFNEATDNRVTAHYLSMMEGSFSQEFFPDATVGGSETVVSALGLYMGAFTEPIAEQMRKAQRQILVNATDVKCQVRIPKPNNTTTGDIFSTSTVLVGNAVYAVASLFNHSCDPNCFLSFVGNPQSCCAKVVVRAIRPIVPGEELSIAYGGLTRFKSHSKSSRIHLLHKRYGFRCRCDPCVNDVDDPVTSEEKEKYVKASDYYQKGCRLIREKDYATAVTVLLQSYEIVMRYICPPPRPPQPMIPTTHQSLALAYFHLNDRNKCLEHLKAALDVDIQIHGTDNRVEMIHEYNRLSSVAIDPGDRKKYSDMAITLLERFYAPSPMLSLTVALMKSASTETSK